MQHPLHAHVAFLQRKIQSLEAQFDEPGRTPDERRVIRADLRVAQLALVHYQKAYELEQLAVVRRSGEPSRETSRAGGGSGG
ncbi:MAG: hypothetical protein WCA44_05305 [Acidobacteriaceae bacterium]